MSIYKELKSQWSNYLLFKSMIPVGEMFKNVINLALYRVGISKVNVHPYMINFLVTNKCNLSCEICSYKKLKETNHNELTFKEISKFIEKISDRNYVFFISGGEPFIREDIMMIIEKIKKIGFRLGICTNGTLLNKDKIDALIQLGIEVIVFSLHGPKKIHNEITQDEESFELLVKTIKYICTYRKRPTVIINCAISQYNIDYLEEIINISKRLNVDALRFEHLAFLTTEEEKAQENIINQYFDNKSNFKINDYILDDIRQDFAEKIKKIMNKKFKFPVLFKPYLDLEELDFWYSKEFGIERKCLFIYHSIFIKPDGIVVPCEFLLYELGNIKKDSLDNIIISEKFTKFRTYLNKGLMPGCHRCCKL